MAMGVDDCIGQSHEHAIVTHMAEYSVTQLGLKHDY